MHTLNLARVGLLLRRRFMLHTRNAPAMLGPALLVFVFAILTTFGSHSPGGSDSFYMIWYFILTLGVGYLFTCAALPEMNSADGRQSYLTLPASNSEKWLATYLYTGPIFFIGFTLLFWVVTLLATGILAMFNYDPYIALNLMDHKVLELAKVYFFVVHPTAILGSIVFNRFAFAKTAGVSMLLSMLFLFATTLIVRLVFYDSFSGFFTPIDNGLSVNLMSEDSWITQGLIAIGGVLLLVASYFKFHEKEV